MSGRTSSRQAMADCGNRTQSSGVSVDARSRTVEGIELSGAETAVLECEISVLVMVERQSTTVPKTSKRSAFGGLVVILGVDMMVGRDGMIVLAGPVIWSDEFRRCCFWDLRSGSQRLSTLDGKGQDLARWYR